MKTLTRKTVLLAAVAMLPAFRLKAQWSTSGNSLPSTGKLGSTNGQPVSFITNNVERWNFSSSGVWKIGALSGTGTSLFQLAADGTASRFNFSGNATDVLTGSGSFSSMSSLSGWTLGSGKVTTTNKVGIGVTSPSLQFEVDGSVGITGTVYATHFIASDASMVQGQLSFTGNMFVNGYDAIAGTRNEVYTSTQPYYIQSAALYNNHTIINHNNTGNLGVGTNSPSAKFHVLGSSRFDGLMRADSIQLGDSLMMKAGGGAFSVGPVLGGGTLSYFLPDCINKGTAKSFMTNKGFYSAWSDAGSVNIGHTGTHALVQSYGEGDAGVLKLNYFCGKDVAICTGTGGGDVFLTSNTTGRVGIGTDCIPSEFKVGVNGKIICEGVRVKNNDSTGCWPDYVFGPNYQPMSIEEVEQYVQQNRHLPHIPSEQEVQREGVDVMELSKAMLKTLEESQLYIIELNKRLEATEKKNAELEAKIKILENK